MSRCDRCHREFRDGYALRRHRARKTPCAPILDEAHASGTAPDRIHQCRYCNRTFASPSSKYRHVREYCKIANSEEGMEKLFEHTLQRQMAQVRSEVAELTTLLKNQLQLAPTSVGPGATAVGAGCKGNNISIGTATNAQIINTTQVNNQVTQNIVIQPWDGEKRISVDVGQIAAAFAENARLKEYARLGDHELTDPAIAPPYVTELLVDLVRRAHTDPAARNIYLNPRRADQVLVHLQSGRWEVVALQEATRMMFDGVAKAMVRVTMSNEERRTLPPEAQNALAMAGLLYDDEPDEYARRAKTPIAAHLTNTAPREGDCATDRATEGQE